MLTLTYSLTGPTEKDMGFTSFKHQARTIFSQLYHAAEMRKTTFKDLLVSANRDYPLLYFALSKTQLVL